MTRSNVDVAGLGASGDDTSLSPRVLVSNERGDNDGPSTNGTSGATHAPRGWQSKLARNLNLDRRKVNDVLLGKRTNARVAAAIADTVGVPASQLWPGKYQRLEYFQRVAHQHATKTQTPRHAEACSATRSPE